MKFKLFVLSLSILFLGCGLRSEDSIHKNTTAPISELAKTKSIAVLDTDFSKGRLLNEQTISLWDVQKLHGHLCDGLVVGFLAMQQATKQLYPNGPIDRTSLRVVAKSSPCIGDVGMFVSGGRYQFNTFYVDNDISGFYVIQRSDNQKTVGVKLRSGIKDPRINTMGKMAASRELPACDLDTLQVLEEKFSLFLLNHPHPEELFEVNEISGFEWHPTLRNDFTKTDVLNKSMQKCGG